MAKEEANDVKDEVVEMPETTEAESSPEENTDQEVDELQEILDSDSDDEDTESEPDTEGTEESDDSEEGESEEAAPEEPDAEETESESEQPQGKAEERKQQLNTEIRGLVSEKKELEDQIRQMNEQVYKPQTVDELVEEGYDESEARTIALERKIELQEYNRQVVDAQIGLAEESDRIMKEFEIFNPDNENYDKDIATAAGQLLESNLIKDPNTGQIIGSHTSPYKLYKPIYDAWKKSQTVGQVKGQKEATRRLASVDAPQSAAPKEEKKDPLLEILTSDDD